jgi:hypothetical protein
MIERFFNNEAEYEAWFQANKTGYVLNYFNGTEAQSKMNKVHNADCPYLRRRVMKGKERQNTKRYVPTTLKKYWNS